MRITARRVAAVLAAPALTISALAVTSSPASAAVDPAPATAAGTWLVGQLDNGIVHNEEYDFDDFGLTIDVALALHTVGAPASVVGSISDAVAAQIDAYVAPGFGTVLSAGGAAKALVLAQAAGDDPTAYGGRDLVADLESRVSTTGPTAGRISDDWDSSDQFAADYANVLGQTYTVEGLDAANSALTDSATDFLLAQQCAAGFFRQSFAAADAADQTCDGGGGEPSVDTTALAIEALHSQLDDTDVAGHVAAAANWLAAQQGTNGSFGADADIPDGNANSTGLAAHALLISGKTAQANKAGAWLRAHQATNVANCVYYAAGDTGAVLYDDAARTTAQSGPMGPALRDQTVRATAQALPGLLAAQAGPGDPQALFTAEYVKAGGKKPVGVIQAAPGEALCAMLGEQSVLRYANADGEASLPVLIPTKTDTSKVKVANAAGTFGTVEINALGAKKLPFTLKNKVAAGKKQVVKVTGLAPGEMVSVSVSWPSKGGSGSGEATGGQANGKGVFKASFTAPNKPGTAKVTVKGEFGTRKASKTFTVTR